MTTDNKNILNLVNFPKKKEDSKEPDMEFSQNSIIEFLETQIKEIKMAIEKSNAIPINKAILIACYGTGPDEYDSFHISAINITSKDFTHLARKIELRYLLDEL